MNRLYVRNVHTYYNHNQTQSLFRISLKMIFSSNDYRYIQCDVFFPHSYYFFIADVVLFIQIFNSLFCYQMWIRPHTKPIKLSTVGVFFFARFHNVFRSLSLFFFHPFYCHIQPFTIVYSISIYLYVLIENPSNQIHSELFLFKSNIYINLSLRPKHLKRLFHVQKWWEYSPPPPAKIAM